MSSKPTIGLIVHYTLSEQDAALIANARANAVDQRPQQRNPVSPGETYPAVVVRDWGCAVNLQVFLDGTDAHWVTSRVEGGEPGQWQWPPRV